MITIENNTATVEFPWPTNDTGRNQSMLKGMSDQALIQIRKAGRSVIGGVVFHDIQREDEGFTWIFKARLRPEGS